MPDIASNADPAAATPFFLPGAADGDGGQEREYKRLRACAQAVTGVEPTDRRIQSIDCRIAGADRHLEVGSEGPVTGAMIVAILDLGRHRSYGVFTTADPHAPALIIGKHVYSVTDFA